jgi:chorismate-pyruvate lyase
MDLTLVQNWSSVKGVGDHELVPGLGPLTSRQRDLLLCLDSMTLALEGFAGTAVRVELRKKGRTTLSRETSAYLGLGPTAGTEAIEREVWLTAGSTRLVYARTLIPLECIDARLLNLLEEKSNEPMGRVLNSRNIPFAKKQLEVGTLRCPPLAADLKIDPDTTLIARRYVLFNGKGAGGGSEPDNKGWSIKAAVFEVFSPEVVRPASRSDSIRGASGLLNTKGGRSIRR